MQSWVEQIPGAVLLGVAIVDVFLTVLYARAGTGLLSPHVARGTWWVFRQVARPLGRHESLVLSLCGPAILVALVLAWASLLSLGAGLIIHPALGTAVRSSSGTTVGDFVTALYVAGSSLSIVGTSGYAPLTDGFKLIFLANSLVGMSALFLTFTYLMQVYSALQTRNATALQVHLQSAETGDAAELIARWAPRGEFDGGYTNLSTLAVDMTTVKESHHFYPVLFYFRFPDPVYSVSRMTLVSLDAVSLAASALDEERYGWLDRSAALTQLHLSCTTMIETLEQTFLPGARRRARRTVSTDRGEDWRERYARALERLRAAGLEVRADAASGADEYVRLREAWDGYVRILAPVLAIPMNQVDPAGSRPRPGGLAFAEMAAVPNAEPHDQPVRG